MTTKAIPPSTMPPSAMVSKVITPKSITLQTPCIRNQRTLVWLQKQKHIAWKKWDAVVTSLKAYHTWSANATIVGIILDTIEKTPTDFYEELFHISTRVPMIFLSQSILSTKSEDYWADNFDNIMCLDDLTKHYPYLGHPYTHSKEDAVALVAHLYRYNRIVDCIVPAERISTFENNIIIEHGIVPPTAWLLTQYFRHPNEERAKEIREALRRNVDCADLSRIVVLTERDESNEFRMFGPKIQQVIIGKRLTYAHFLQYVTERVPKNVIAILANADIYLEDLTDLWKIRMHNVMLSLLRWDCTDSGVELFGPRADSQDTWIVLSDSVKSVKWTYEPFDVQLGQPGCDNMFAGLMLQNHFVLYNPALTLKTYHLHSTQIRNYTKGDAVRAPLYVNLVPSYLIDTKQDKKLASFTTVVHDTVAFTIKSSSMSNEITFCTMLEKEGRYLWEPSVENYYFNEIPIYQWKNACVTPNGLVYTPYTIYPGDDERYPFWNGSTVGIFTPLQSVDQLIAIPFADLSVFANRDLYFLYYYSRILGFLEQYPTASYWAPPGWTSIKGNPITVSTTTACYAKEIIGFLPGPLELGKEEIQRLRAYIPVTTMVSKRCIVIGTWENKKQLSDIFYKDWYVDVIADPSIKTLSNAALCIILPDVPASIRSRIWALPIGTCLLEFQQELTMNGDCQHLAHVCELNAWVLLLSKGSVSTQIVQQLSRWIVKHEDEIIQ